MEYLQKACPRLPNREEMINEYIEEHPEQRPNKQECQQIGETLFNQYIEDNWQQMVQSIPHLEILPSPNALDLYTHNCFVFNDYINPARCVIELFQSSQTNQIFVPPSRDFEFSHFVAPEHTEEAVNRVFDKEKSVFKPWIVDNDRNLALCFKYD